MRFLRYQKNDEVRWGWLDGTRIGAVVGDVFGDYKREGTVAELHEVTVLPPVPTDETT